MSFGALGFTLQLRLLRLRFFFCAPLVSHCLRGCQLGLPPDAIDSTFWRRLGVDISPSDVILTTLGVMSRVERVSLFFFSCLHLVVLWLTVLLAS